MSERIINEIISGKTSLGIELGSTRIKAQLVDKNAVLIASGDFEWENQLIDGIWTYSDKDIWAGIQATFSNLKADVKKQYNVELNKIGSIGFSAMMHGYLAFDKNDSLLVPFRTWRNATTEVAAKELTEIFNFNIPQRWSIAHLYQAMLDGEDHVSEITYFTTLAGYVHWKLTGEKVLGIGDASGMFPIDDKLKDYDQDMINKFDLLVKENGYNFKLRNLLPKSLQAGVCAGQLTKEGALLLDPTGDLKDGIPFAPAEGDAGTGMVATNSITPNTGNLSAGTSVFAMIVLENQLSKVYPEIDMVTTPDGHSVAMVHVNNCTSEINAWVSLFGDLLDKMGVTYKTSDLYEKLFNSALEADEDDFGNLVYGYHSGENITNLPEGRPLLVRMPNAKFDIANLMRAQIESAFATLNIGMQTLFNEGIKIESIVGHGGIFKTKDVAQKIVAAAVESSVTLMDTASEGGAWGMALLSQYVLENDTLSLREFLNEKVFHNTKTLKYTPTEKEILRFRKFVEKYEKGLDIEVTAVKKLKG